MRLSLKGTRATAEDSRPIVNAGTVRAARQ
jgi:hypothetical protein